MTFCRIYYLFEPYSSLEKQKAVHDFYSSFSKLYPCSYCAEELRADLAKHSVKAESREALSIWTCEMHNRVNERLGKPIVPCTMDFLGKFSGKFLGIFGLKLILLLQTNVG